MGGQDGAVGALRSGELHAGNYPEEIHFQIIGVPAPQGSKKHVGRGRLVEMSKRLPAWRKAVLDAASELVDTVGTFDGQLRVQAVFVLARPKRSKFAGPAGSPDLDKLQRSLGDGLQAAGLIADDARITHWVAAKRWAVGDEPTGAQVHIRHATPAPATDLIEETT